jgi:hypothetical protein
MVGGLAPGLVIVTIGHLPIIAANQRTTVGVVN